MMNGVLHHGFRRIERLDKHVPAAFRTPRTASRLAQQLEQFFSRTEIGNAKPRIGTNNPDKFDTRKVMAFRDHLRSKQNIVFAVPE